MFQLTEDFENSSFPAGFFEVKNFLSNDEIDTINKHTTHLLSFNGVTQDTIENQNPSFIRYDEEKQSKEYRDSKICWLYPKNNQDIKNIYKKIIKLILQVNQAQFKFNLTDLETLQYTVYKEGQFYKKHLDITPLDIGNTLRKLSFSIQLSDPKEYEGGDLLGFIGENNLVAEKEKGSVIFFSSFVLHEVTPVTKGVRKSLVGWVHGPRFR